MHSFFEPKSFRPLTYVAGPYTHSSWGVKVRRFQRLTQITSYLMQEFGWNCFSPITHSHPLHEAGMRGDWQFWARIDEEYLLLSNRLVVCMEEGWKESVGVTAEIKIAKSLRVPVTYFDFHLLKFFTDEEYSQEVCFRFRHNQSEGPNRAD